MQVKELLLQGHAFVGEPITVTGRLFVTGDNASFVAVDFDSFIRHERVAISDNSLIANHLLNLLPAYGGGSCIYDEDCTVSGSFHRHQNGYELVDVKSCVVKRDDTVIEIPFSAASAT